MSDLRIRFNRPQSLTHRALRPGWTVATPWGRGVGKSHFLRQALYLNVAEHDGRVRVGALKLLEGVRWVLMAPTFKQAKDLHAQDLEADLTGDGPWAFLGAKIDRTSWRVTFPGGSWIQLFGAENAHASRGLRTDGCAVDECDDVDLPVFDSVINPWFSEPWSLKIKLVCGTPRRGRYGLLYRTYRRATSPDPEERRSEHYAHHATGYDTPETVDRAYLDKMKAETPPATFAREYECSFDAGEGLVYSLFDETFHVRNPAMGTVYDEILVGGDHGWEDPGVFLAIGVIGSGREARAEVIYEVYASHKIEDWWVEEAKKIIAWFPNAKWYLDPSRPDRIAALARKAGIRVATDVDNTLQDGVDVVSAMLFKRRRGDGDGTEYARLYIASSCKNTIAEFGLYRRKRDPRNKDQYLDDIEDKNNHAMDALRYPIFARFRSSVAGPKQHPSIEDRQ